MRTHESRPNWIRLELVAGSKAALKDRSGFAIHGRGSRGSDGCIVPTDFNIVTQIYALVKARETAGKPAPALTVVAIGNLDRFEKLNRTA